MIIPTVMTSLRIALVKRPSLGPTLVTTSRTRTLNNRAMMGWKIRQILVKWLWAWVWMTRRRSMRMR